MADVMVLATQKWLNETYGKVSGYGRVPENGRTGWDTIYGLIRGLQVELSISPLSNNFGPTTFSRFQAIEKTLVIGGKYNENIVHIMQGGFWCKGYDVAAFNGVITETTNQTVRNFARDAGLIDQAISTQHNGQMTAMLMKALLDMSAFVLIPGRGDKNVRTIQQALNKNYNAYFGLLPCDGIYQRETNKALIYGLQAEIGMGVGEANGYFGEGTTARCPSLSYNMGTSGQKKIMQYGLYVNGFNRNAAFDGVFTNYIEQQVIQYRQFMRLAPEAFGVADMRVIKGLLVSHGDQTRQTYACDMATQLKTQAQVDIILNAGYSTVGRYLTGTVGMGADERPKNLTRTEMDLIKKNKMRVFPIYQDGGWYANYFKNSDQGRKDARKAAAASNKLGFKQGTIIYFACDFDALGHEIDDYLVPYFRAIKETMTEVAPGYIVSAYGPRNLLNTLSEKGLIMAGFVSDMSSGFSGNLGFPMPAEWSFDQYIETSVRGIPIDKVAVSERTDVGQNSFIEELPPIDKNGLTQAQLDAHLYEKFLELRETASAFSAFPSIGFMRDKKMSRKVFGAVNDGVILMDLTLSMKTELATESAFMFNVVNGKVDSAEFINELEALQVGKDIMDTKDNMIDMMDRFGDYVSNDGTIQIGVVPDYSLGGPGFGIELAIISEMEIKAESGEVITQQFSTTFNFFYRRFQTFLPNLSLIAFRLNALQEEELFPPAMVAGGVTLGILALYLVSGPAAPVAATLALIGIWINDNYDEPSGS